MTEEQMNRIKVCMNCEHLQANFYRFASDNKCALDEELVYEKVVSGACPSDLWVIEEIQ